jgi:hypothetical protein
MSGTNFCLIISTTPTTGAGLLVRCRLLLRPFHLRPSHRRHRVNATIRRATKPAASTVKSAADPDIVWPRASSMTTSTMAARSARSSRSGAPARDGRRRLRPWTVTQPWTPRTRPPLLGKRADAFPTPPTAVHGTREKQEEPLALARGKGIRRYSCHLPRGRFSNVPQWPHLNVR